MIASLRWERNIIWEDLTPEDKANAQAWWIVRGRNANRES